MPPFLMIFSQRTKSVGPCGAGNPFTLSPFSNSYTQISSLSAKPSLLLMGTLMEDKGNGSGSSIPGSLENLILEAPLISAMVPLSQV